CFITEKEPGAAENPGLTIPPKIKKMGYKGVESTELVYDGFKCAPERVLGGEEGVGKGFVQMMDALEVGRANVAARGVGIALIATAVNRLQAEVPAIKQLKLVIKLELRARGGDAPIWRVEVPGPKIDKDPAGDARLEVSVSRSHFNELATDGRLRDWAQAYDHGHVRVSGDSSVVKLLGNVIAR